MQSASNLRRLAGAAAVVGALLGACGGDGGTSGGPAGGVGPTGEEAGAAADGGADVATSDAAAPPPPDESLTLCAGATSYVSAVGSDANDGSQASPWATVAKAAASVAAGSTIHVAAGTYLETEKIELPVGVCLEGEGPSTVLKSTLTADWTPILEASSPAGADGHQHISNLKLDGQSLATFWGISVAGRDNVSIHDVTVVDFKDRGVLMTGRFDNPDGPPTAWAKGLFFHDNTVLNSAAYDTPNGVYGRGCLNVGGTEGMLIFNNVITQNQRPVGFNGWPIKGMNNGFNRGLKIYDNHLNKIPYTGANPGDNGWDFAVEMFSDQGTEFFRNVVVGGGFDTNIQTKGTYPYSLWIHDNAFSLPAVVNSDNWAVTLEFDSDTVIVENNTIDNMSGCVLFTPRPGNTISNVTIVGNLCAHVSKGAGDGSNAEFINLAPGESNFNIDGLRIYNNTFLADAANRPWWGIDLGGATVGTRTNVDIKNNILGHTKAGAISANGPLSNVTVSNNDIFDIVQSNDPVFGQPPTNYTAANNLHVDPLFVSATDFHLQAGSPALDVGVKVGRPFKGPAPDLGYAER